MTPKINKFSVPPLKINMEIIDTEQYRPKVQSRCSVTRMRNASFDDIMDEMAQMNQKFGLPYSIVKIRRD